MTPRTTLGTALAVAALLLALAAPAQAARVSGTLVLDTGRQSGSRVEGSFFRMRFPGGRRYFRNPDSRLRDRTYTPLRRGRDGGIVAGRYQGSRRFDGNGNSRANRIIRPVRFAGIRFGLATFRVDPQSRRRVRAPVLDITGRRLTADLSSLSATWNRQVFNQGAPKPGASRGYARGRYNPRTRRFLLRWRSRIRGGAFNGFIGEWQLTGRLRR